MDYLPTALIMSRRLMSLEAFSALPDAPVVPHAEPRQPVRRSRTAAASLMYRLGDVLAPARPVRSARS